MTMPHPLNHRICVSSWSFHNLFESTRYPGAIVPAKDMDILDFPEIVAEHFHVHNVEVVSKHLLSAEPSYIAEFHQRLKKANARLINIPIDIPELWDAPSISSPNDTVRNHALNLYMDWIDRAAALKPQTVRCDPASADSGDHLARQEIPRCQRCDRHARIGCLCHCQGY